MPKGNQGQMGSVGVLRANEMGGFIVLGAIIPTDYKMSFCINRHVNAMPSLL